ncbi:MAG: hypothetical protein LBC86_03080 [Oscillospiraceae bacterium]|nr:hypothetical protein [Oscillospiraceae bacterium]
MQKQKAVRIICRLIFNKNPCTSPTIRQGTGAIESQKSNKLNCPVLSDSVSVKTVLFTGAGAVGLISAASA